MGKAVLARDYDRGTPLTDIAKLYLQGQAIKAQRESEASQTALNNQMMNFREGFNTGAYTGMDATDFNRRLAGFGLDPVQQWTESGGELFQPYATEPNNRATNVGLSDIAKNEAAAFKDQQQGGLYGAQANQVSNQSKWLGDIYSQHGSSGALAAQSNGLGFFNVLGGRDNSGNPLSHNMQTTATKNAMSMGLVPGTAEFKDYILGSTTSGLSLETNPDGTITFRQGTGNLARGTKGDVEKGIMSAQRQLDEIDHILNGTERDLFETLPRFQNKLAQFGSKMGFPMDPQDVDFTNRFESVITPIEQLFNAYRKEITGSAAAIQELQSLRNTYINGDLSYEVFMARATALADQARRNLLRNQEVLGNPSALNTPHEGEPTPAAPANSEPSGNPANQLIMDAQSAIQAGADPETVKQALANDLIKLGVQ